MSPYRSSEAERAYSKAWKLRNPDRVREHKIKQNHGVSLERYAELLEMQGGVCAICYRAPESGRWKGKYDRLYIDHCHDSDAIRGLLCFACNTGISRFGDKPEFLRNAALYLEGSDA